MKMSNFKKNNKTNVTRKILILMIGVLVLAGCNSSKIIQITYAAEYPLEINEKNGTKVHPSYFYFSNVKECPCHLVTNKWSGEKVKKNIKTKKHLAIRKKQKAKSKIKFEKPMEKINESVRTPNNCIYK
jgi:hypothetical protein